MTTTTRRANARGNTARASWRPALTRLQRQMQTQFTRETRALQRRIVQQFKTEGARIARSGSA